MLIRFVKVSYFGWNPCVMAGIERAPKANVNFLGHVLCLTCSFFSYAHIKICQVVKILKCNIEYSTEVCSFLLRSKGLSLVDGFYFVHIMAIHEIE